MNNQQKGYTLIEVLAVLFIFIIVISIISFTFIQILKNIDVVKQREERLADIQAMLTTLEFDFSQVINKTLPAGNNQFRGSFYTHDKKLHLIKIGNINPDYQFNRSSLEEVEYYIENHQLIKQLKEDNQPIKKQILLKGIDSFEWVLYDEKLGQYGNWPPTQDWQYQTPIAIKLRLHIEGMGQIEKIIDMANHD